MSAEAPNWHAQAKRLKAEGWTLTGLAALFGTSESAITQALGESEDNRQRASRTRLEAIADFLFGRGSEA